MRDSSIVTRTWLAILFASVLSCSFVHGAQPATKDLPQTKQNTQATPSKLKKIAQKSDVPAPKMSRENDGSVDARFKELHEKNVARVKQGNADLLFIGDSITEDFGNVGKEVWDKFYSKRNAVNLGVSSDQTQNALWRLQNGELDGPIKPKVAVIMIGTNNIRAHSANEIASGINEIVKTVRTKLPETKILLLAIFPRNLPGDNKERKARITATNELIKKLDDGKMIYCLDIGPKFLDKNGELTKEVMPDLAHPSKVGYQIWAEAIEEPLAKLLGEK